MCIECELNFVTISKAARFTENFVHFDGSSNRTFIQINKFKIVGDHVLQAKRKLEKVN